MSPVSVTALTTTAVKGMRVGTVGEIELTELGATGNRAFYVVDERGRMLNGKQLGALQAIVPAYDRDAETLTLTFPDGQRASAALAYGKVVATRFFSVEVEARELRGPWAEAISSYTGKTLRLVRAGNAVDRGRQGATSIISRGSLRRLAQAAGHDELDPRRFRMLIEIDGVQAHEEDGWVGRRVRVGEAVLAMHGHVGRCLITSRDPDSGELDVPTLDVLRDYRGDLQTTEPLPFGIYGEVLEGGTVHVGDHVTLVG